MQISITQLCSILTEEIGKETAETLTSYSEEKNDKTVVDKTSHLASKEDLANIKVDMIKWIVGLFIILGMMIVGLYFR